MVSPKVCRHEVLASNGVAQVQRCLDCDCVSIHVGPLTFRLDPNSLEVRSELSSNDANVWKGYARFVAGFNDWRFAAVGGVTGGLPVPDQNMFDVVLGVQGVVNVQHGAARITKHGIYALFP